jgi:hypothetical protein
MATSGKAKLLVKKATVGHPLCVCSNASVFEMLGLIGAILY